MNTPVRLLHIPKTAGTSISSALLLKYGRKHAFPFTGSPPRDRERLMAVDPKRRSEIRLFYGHSYYETGVEEADRARIITFLREPMDRAISFVHHASERKEKYLPETGPGAPFTVSAFLDTGNPELRNLQTKILTNLDDAGLAKLGEDAAFELARNRLFDGLIAFGIQARFDDSWVAIWKLLGHKPPVYLHLRRANQAAKLPFTPEEIDRIKDMNRLDLRLYQAAEAEFDRRVAAVPTHQAECAAFKARQKRFGPAFSMAWGVAKKIRRALR